MSEVVADSNETPREKNTLGVFLYGVHVGAVREPPLPSLVVIEID